MMRVVVAIALIAMVSCADENTDPVDLDIDGAADTWLDGIDTASCTDAMGYVSDAMYESCLHQGEETCIPALNTALIDRGLECCDDDPSLLCATLDRAFDVETCSEVMSSVSDGVSESCMHQDPETCVPALTPEMIGKGLGCCGDDPSLSCVTLDRAFDEGTCTEVMEIVSGGISESCMHQDEETCMPALDPEYIGKGLGCCADDPSLMCVTLDRAFDAGTCTEVMEIVSGGISESCMHQGEETCVPALDPEYISKGLSCCGDDPNLTCITLDRAFDIGTCPDVMARVADTMNELCGGSEICTPVMDRNLIAQGLGCCGDDPSEICVRLDTAVPAE